LRASPALVATEVGKTGKAENLKTSRHIINQLNFIFMKSLKVLFGTLAVVALISAFAFTSANKKVDIQTYYFTAANKYIGSPNTNELQETQVKTQGNYTTTNPGYTFSNNSYLAAITFDEDLLSLQDAINGVWSNYSPSHTLPADNSTITVNGVSVTIRRKSTN
jgi:uncharacterized protein YxeA